MLWRKNAVEYSDKNSMKSTDSTKYFVSKIEFLCFQHYRKKKLRRTSQSFALIRIYFHDGQGQTTFELINLNIKGANCNKTHQNV